MTGSWYNSISLFPIVQADPPQLRYLAGGSSFSGKDRQLRRHENLTRHVKYIRHSDLSDGNCCHDEVIEKQRKRN